MNFILPQAILVGFGGGAVIIGALFLITVLSGADDKYVQKQKDDLQKLVDNSI